MNQIFQRQQQTESIKLLAAQKQLYTEGKRLHSWILLISFLSALIFPLLSMFLPNLEIGFGTIGGILSTIMVLIFSRSPQKKRYLGAKVQEQFDTDLFGLEWQDEIYGEPLSPHEIERAANKLKNRKNIDGEPWYKDYSNLEISKAILSCQQENLYWDGKLRKRYSNFLKLTGLLLFLCCYLIGFFVLDLTPAQWLAQVFFPLIVFLFLIQDTLSKNVETSINQAAKVAEARALVRKYKNSSAAVPNQELRNIQDDIFAYRSESPMVPDWFYNLNRKYFDKTLGGTAKDINKANLNLQD